MCLLWNYSVTENVFMNRNIAIKHVFLSGMTGCFERGADILDITHRHYEQHSFDNHLEIVTKSWRLVSFS